MAELPKVAMQLLEFAGKNKLFLFEGDLAAGKTTLIKEICKLLGVNGLVSSPSFSIVNEYQGADVIYHLDFYRLQSPEEAFDFGYEEYLFSNKYCFVEWPSKIRNILPQEHIKVSISSDPSGSRIFNIDHSFCNEKIV